MCPEQTLTFKSRRCSLHNHSLGFQENTIFLLSRWIRVRFSSCEIPISFWTGDIHTGCVTRLVRVMAGCVCFGTQRQKTCLCRTQCMTHSVGTLMRRNHSSRLGWSQFDSSSNGGRSGLFHTAYVTCCVDTASLHFEQVSTAASRVTHNKRENTHAHSVVQAPTAEAMRLRTNKFIFFSICL